MGRLPRDFPVGHCYHLMSRVAHQEMMLWVDECDYMANLIYRLEIFSGIKVLTFAIMNSHFHVLLRLDDMPPGILTDAEIIRRVGVLDGEAAASCLKTEVKRLSRLPNGAELVREELDRYANRMYDISEFMKTFKQRLTVMFNARTGHKGTMWEDRFKSIRVQTNKTPLSVVASYVDLNPVRANMVQDPRDYKWSGFHEAVQGRESARQGYAIIYGMEGEPWEKICYQHLMCMKERAPQIAANERAFLNGGAFGSEKYIKEYYKEVMPKHRSNPRIPRGGVKAWGDLRFARRIAE